MSKSLLYADLPSRAFRFIELRAEEGADNFELSDGWFVAAADIAGDGACALLEGGCLVQIPNGARFKEFTYKTIHSAVADALPVWAESEHRRWALFDGEHLVLSNGERINLSELVVTKVR